MKKILTESEIRKNRIKICESCENFIKISRQCSICKCFMDIKSSLAFAECPIKKWESVSLENKKTLKESYPMTAWAKIENDNIVSAIASVDPELPDYGKEYIESNYSGRWILVSRTDEEMQTGEDAIISAGIENIGHIYKNYPGIGYYFDEERRAFLMPKPFESWTLDEDIFEWVPPIARPDDENSYIWNEKDQKWDIAAVIHESM